MFIMEMVEAIISQISIRISLRLCCDNLSSSIRKIATRSNVIIRKHKKNCMQISRMLMCISILDTSARLHLSTSYTLMWAWRANFRKIKSQRKNISYSFCSVFPYRFHYFIKYDASEAHNILLGDTDDQITIEHHAQKPITVRRGMEPASSIATNTSKITI